MECFAFFVDQAAEIPLAMRVLEPGYSRARNAFELLETERPLKPDSPGFQILADEFLVLLAEQNDPASVSRVSVQQFARGTARLSIGPDKAGEEVPVQVLLSNGQTLEWDLESISTVVESMRGGNSLLVSIGIFSLGALIQIAGFVIHRYRDRHSED